MQGLSVFVRIEQELLKQGTGTREIILSFS